MWWRREKEPSVSKEAEKTGKGSFVVELIVVEIQRSPYKEIPLDPIATQTGTCEEAGMLDSKLEEAINSLKDQLRTDASLDSFRSSGNYYFHIEMNELLSDGTYKESDYTRAI